MKMFAALALSGIAALALLKLLAAVALPLLGLVFGLFLLTTKLVVLGVVAYLVYSWVRRSRSRSAA